MPWLVSVGVPGSTEVASYLPSLSLRMRVERTKSPLILQVWSSLFTPSPGPCTGPLAVPASSAQPSPKEQPNYFCIHRMAASDDASATGVLGTKQWATL